MPIAVDAWTNPIGGSIDLTTDDLVTETIWDRVIGNEEYLYRRRVAEFLNNSGGAILARDVVVLDTTANDAFTTTTTPGDGRVLGVAAEDIAAGVTGKIVTGGLADVLVNGTTARGDFISTSGTAKQGAPSATAGANDFARATQARVGTGLVKCYLFGPGRVGSSGLVGAHAFHSVAQSIANATLTALAFNSERYDTDTIHDTVTNNSRLTCKTAGKYVIGVIIQWDAMTSSGTQRSVQIRLNGITNIAQGDFAGMAAISNVGCVTAYDLAVNDYVEAIVYQADGAARNVVVSSNISPEFWMHRVAG